MYCPALKLFFNQVIIGKKDAIANQSYLSENPENYEIIPVDPMSFLVYPKESG